MACTLRALSCCPAVPALLLSVSITLNLTQSNLAHSLSPATLTHSRQMEYLLNTGNLVSRSGLDLSQTAGFTVVAEKLNFFRYLSHFRCELRCEGALCSVACVLMRAKVFCQVG